MYRYGCICLLNFRSCTFRFQDSSMNNDPCYSFISREDVVVKAKATRRNLKTTRLQALLRHNKNTIGAMRQCLCDSDLVHERVLTSSCWHQRAANEPRDIASFWKRSRVDVNIETLRPPSYPISLFVIPAYPPLCSSSRDCGCSTSAYSIQSSKLRGARADPGRGRATSKR